MQLAATLRRALLRVRAFRINLISDWKKVAFRAWSVRLWVASSLILFFEPLVELAIDLSDTWSLAVRVLLRMAGGLLGILGIWARIVKQKDFENADQ